MVESARGRVSRERHGKMVQVELEKANQNLAELIARAASGGERGRRLPTGRDAVSF